MAEQKKLYAEAVYRYKSRKFLTKLEDVIFISTNYIVSFSLYYSNNTRLFISTMNTRGHFTYFVEDMAGK